MLVLEQDVIMGTFTHREKYLPSLCKSIREHLPHISFMLQVANLPINQNFNALREKFKQSGKRFWLFLDDDIQFLFPDTIKIALETIDFLIHSTALSYSPFVLWHFAMS